MIQPNRIRDFTVALVHRPLGYLGPVTVTSVTVQARTWKEAQRKAKVLRRLTGAE